MPGAAEIVVCHGNFAGRTTPPWSDFRPKSSTARALARSQPGFVQVPFGDSDALGRGHHAPTLQPSIVEPIQGEAGIVVPPRGYLARCAEICRRHNVLLICDEGPDRPWPHRPSPRFRTRQRHSRWHLRLARALGGGLLPVSAFVARKDVMDVFTPGDHGSTFGGNPLAAAVGSAALELLMQDDLCAHAEAMGERLMTGLRDIDTPLISEVRGRGLLIGVEIEPRLATARMACEAPAGTWHPVERHPSHSAALRTSADHYFLAGGRCTGHHSGVHCWKSSAPLVSRPRASLTRRWLPSGTRRA